MRISFNRSSNLKDKPMRCCSISSALLSFLSVLAIPAFGQHSTATLTQVVDPRGMVLELFANPNSNLTPGSSVSFSALLNTSGVSPATGETIQFLDGSNLLGTGAITSATATNLLPFSEDFSKWTALSVVSAAPALSMTGTGPDGRTNSATTFTFPATPSSAISGVTFGLPGTSYDGQAMTLSAFFQAATAGSIILQLTDDPKNTVMQTHVCNFPAGWSRCEFSMIMPSSAGSGIAVSFLETNAPAQTVTITGVQLEQSAIAGPYVLTTGQSTSGQGGIATFSTTGLLAGLHSISAAYAGDTNFLPSSSLVSSLDVEKGGASITLAATSNTLAYGAQDTFTATVSGSGLNPTGTIAFMDGSTVLSTVTLNNGVATFPTSGLLAGSHSISAVYSGDNEYNGATSTAVTVAISQVAATVTGSSSLNPSIYGDNVTLTIKAVGVGVVPTGTVTITDGASSLGTLTLDSTGQATLTTKALNAGSHTLAITYSGDNNYF